MLIKWLKKWTLPCASSALLLLCVSSAQAQQLIPAPPELAAKSWILIDAETGHVIVENNADLQLPPASLVKMMTTYIVSNEIAEGRVKKDDMVLISDNAWEKGGAKTDGSTMFLSPRTRVSVSDLMRGVIIQSGNDASIALAEHISGDEDAFTDSMNQQAALMGMTGTEYFNATGLPYEGMVSTARDLSVLARAIIQEHPDHYSIYAEKYFKHNNIRQPNRNRLLWRDSSVDGLKTGHTEEAGYCLVASAKRKDMRLISVVMGANSDKTRASQSQKLLSYGFRYFNTKTIYAVGDIIKENAKVWYGEDEFLNLTISDDVTLTLARGAEKKLEANIVMDEQLKTPIVTGQELGRLQVSLEGEIVVDIPLVAAADVEQSGLFSRFIDWIVLTITQLLS